MNNKTILIVDDTIENLDILSALLEAYDVVETTSGVDALEIVNNQEIDLILLDIIMPNLNGFEVCQKLKSHPKTSKIPIIFLSAKSSQDDIQKGFEIGAVDYVTKPFNPTELLSRVQTHLELYKYQSNLEQQVQVELQKSKDKDEMIFHQSKLISMGEMMANIAHQWRQPLAQINSSVFRIDAMLEDLHIQDVEIEKQLQDIETTTEYMSNTINDFKDFFEITKQREKFTLNIVIQNALNIIGASLKYHDIKVELFLENELPINTYKNELQQVLLILMNNAKDTLLINQIAKPKISIITKLERDQVSITVKDNGGGVDEKIIHKIFEPYFTTKHQTQGTGLGLYISKMIIEKSARGSLSVLNTKDGASFKIMLAIKS